MNRSRRTLVVLALLAISARAWADYPRRPITMIVPFPPGGVADAVARPLADGLSRELKQPVIVENRSGAGGALGMGVAARAPADGYTILLTLSSISILPEADKILGRKPQFQGSSFRPIARITADPTVLVVRSDAPWKNLQEFVAAARRQPGAMNYGSSGNYGTMQIPMEMLIHTAGFQMVHIPFTGAGPAVTALLGGQVDALASGPSSVLAEIRAGKLRALAHWGDRPLTSLPGVPSLTGWGYPVKFTQWSGVFVNIDTPAPTVQRLRDAIRKVVAGPALQRTLVNVGSQLDYLDAPEFATYWQRENESMRTIVRNIGKLN